MLTAFHNAARLAMIRGRILNKLRRASRIGDERLVGVSLSGVLSWKDKMQTVYVEYTHQQTPEIGISNGT